MLKCKLIWLVTGVVFGVIGYDVYLILSNHLSKMVN